MPISEKPHTWTPFIELGRLVERQWIQHHNDVEEFPNIATAALHEFQVLDGIELNLLFGELLAERHVQPRHEFSDLAIRLYETPEFYVELLVWLEGRAAIHEHPFSGAFKVIGGGSVHGHYEFQTDVSICSRLHIGKPLLIRAEVLKPGDVRKILPGSALLHGLFHFEQPSFTLVLRTKQEKRYLPQLAVDLPHFAADYELRFDPEVEFCVKAINTAYAIEPKKSEAMLLESVSQLDLARAYSVCTNLFFWEYVTSQSVSNQLEERLQGLSKLVSDVVSVRKKLQLLQRYRVGACEKEDLFYIGLLSVIHSSRHVREILERHGGVEEGLARLAKVLVKSQVCRLGDDLYSEDQRIELLRSFLKHEDRKEFLERVPRTLEVPGSEKAKRYFRSYFENQTKDPFVRSFSASAAD